MLLVVADSLGLLVIERLAMNPDCFDLLEHLLAALLLIQSGFLEADHIVEGGLELALLRLFSASSYCVA